MVPASVGLTTRKILFSLSGWRMMTWSRHLMIRPFCKAYDSPARESLECILHWPLLRPSLLRKTMLQGCEGYTSWLWTYTGADGWLTGCWGYSWTFKLIGAQKSVGILSPSRGSRTKRLINSDMSLIRNGRMSSGPMMKQTNLLCSSEGHSGPSIGLFSLGSLFLRWELVEAFPSSSTEEPHSGLSKQKPGNLQWLFDLRIRPDHYLPSWTGVHVEKPWGSKKFDLQSNFFLSDGCMAQRGRCPGGRPSVSANKRVQHAYHSVLKWKLYKPSMNTEYDQQSPRECRYLYWRVQ